MRLQLSSFALNFNVRRYVKVRPPAATGEVTVAGVDEPMDMSTATTPVVKVTYAVPVTAFDVNTTAALKAGRG